MKSNRSSSIMKIMVMYLSMVITISPFLVVAYPNSSPAAVERWFHNLYRAQEKLTKLHFYIQDKVSGPNPSAVEIARSGITDSSPNSFGLTRIFDDPLTVKGDPDSEVIGYGQGIYSSASQHDASLFSTFNVHFTAGEYDGSSLSLQGRSPAGAKYRELSVVGGTGVFRLARGTAVASTHWANATTQDGIVEFSVYAFYFDLFGAEGSESDV